ncbi:MAG: sulfotransferase [Pseudomonadales bacterium]
MNTIDKQFSDSANTIIDVKLAPNHPHHRLSFYKTYEIVEEFISLKNITLAVFVNDQLRKQFPDALKPKSLLCKINFIQENFNAVLSLSKDILDLDPCNKEALLFMAHSLRALSKADQALPLLEKLVSMCSSDITYVELGRCYSDIGQGQSALAAFNQAIKLNPDITGAYIGRADIPGITVDAVELQHMQKLATDERISVENRARMHFSIAPLLASQGHYQLEFDHLDQANRLMQEKFPYSIEQEKKITKEIIEKFTGTLLKQLNPIKEQSIRPIFIVGMPRSGSTLIEQILGAHSSVSSCGESNAIARAIYNTALQRPLWQLSARELNNNIVLIDQQHRELLTKQNINTSIFTDKSLDNYSLMGLILAMYPQAKIIHCLRHPLDVVLSCYRHFFTLASFTYSLENIAERYKLHLSLMDHWTTLRPDNILRIELPHLVNNQRAATERLLEFCDLPWNDSCIDYYKSNRNVKTASNHQVRQPLMKSRLELWRPYAEFLKPAADILNIDITTGEVY